jgi:hypothetical protein
MLLYNFLSLTITAALYWTPDESILYLSLQKDFWILILVFNAKIVADFLNQGLTLYY